MSTAFRLRRNLGILLVWMIAWSPAILLGAMVHRYAVNHLFLDDWERVPVIEKFREGTLTLGDLYAPHINHRMVFPRVLMLAANEAWRGDVRPEMALIFLCSLASALGVFVLLQRTCATSTLPLAGLTLLCNLAIFSPMQWENWLWSVQLGMVLPMPLVVWAVVIVREPWRWWVRALVCVTLGLVATHSFGHGFVVWLAILFAAIADRGAFASRRDRLAFVGVCLGVAAAAMACYFLVDYRNVSHSSHAFGVAMGDRPPAFLLQEDGFPVRRFLGFVFVLGGNLVARFPHLDPIPVAGWIGATLILGIGWVAIRLRITGKAGDVDWWDRAVPWLAVAGAALAALCALALGRLGFERTLVRALSSRYLAMGLYLTVAAFPLAWLWTRHFLSRRPERATTLVGLSSFCLGAGCLLFLPSWSYGSAMMRQTSHNFLQGKAQLMFCKHFDLVDPARRIDFNPEFFLEQVEILERYRLLRPPPLESLELARFKPLNKPRPLTQAEVIRITETETNGLEIQGTGALTDRPADLVLVTTGHDLPSQQIVAIGMENADAVRHPYPRHDLSHAGKRTRNNPLAMPWTALVSADRVRDLPPDAVLRVWLLDVRKMRAYRVAGEWKRNPDGRFAAP